jgi:hypothetical protein
MNLRKLLTTSFCLTLFCLLALPASLMAGERDQATQMTFNESVEVPGQVLAAGTYWFALMDSQSDRNIVQIWNEDRSQLIATVFTIADYRVEPADETLVTFEERPGDQAEAIQSWFYPGENSGHEFIYPKNRAMSVAQQPVSSMSNDAAN